MSTLSLAYAERGLSDSQLVARRGWRQRWHADRTARGRTVGDVLAEGAERFGDARLVFSAAGEATVATLAEVHEQGRLLAGALHRLGLRSGDVLAVQVPNRVEAVVTFHAAAALGLVLLPVVHIYGAAELQFILRQSGAKALVVPDRWRNTDFAERVTELEGAPQLEHVVVIGSTDAFAGTARTTAWSDLQSDATLDFPSPNPASDDIALLIYTSGTTADPKGVLHTHDSMVAELFCSPTPPADPPRRGTLQPFPAGHTAGVMSLLGPAAHGCDTVLMDSWDAELAAVLIEQWELYSMAGTPYYINTLLEVVDRGERRLPSLREILTGGAGVPPSIVERADERGWKVLRCYGATEQPSAVSCARTDALATRASADGRAIGGGQLKLVDDDGVEVPDGTPGEILLVGPEQFAGYTDPALNGPAFDADGWFRTGDIGIRENDLLRLVDRKKDIVIRGGENISALEVEGVLLRHRSVEEAAVVASPDPLYGERAFAFVVLRPGTTLDLDEVRSHFASSGVAKQKAPEGLEIITELPRTAAGKVKKHELRDRFS